MKRKLIAIILIMILLLTIGNSICLANGSTDNNKELKTYHLTANDITSALRNQYVEYNGIVNWYNNGSLILREGNYIIDEDLDFASLGVLCTSFENGTYTFQGDGDIINFGDGWNKSASWTGWYDFETKGDTVITFNNINIVRMHNDGYHNAGKMIFNGGKHNTLELDMLSPGEENVILNNVEVDKITGREISINGGKIGEAYATTLNLKDTIIERNASSSCDSNIYNTTIEGSLYCTSGIMENMTCNGKANVIKRIY